MKQLLMSIQPQHLYNILTGKKTLEVRKQIPKGFKGWVNLYCTKGKRLSVVHDDENGKTYYYLNSNWGRELNQDIPCRFWFDEYETMDTDYSMWVIAPKRNKEILEQSCLAWEEADKYANYKTLYAMHIKQLEIFDKPMELQELNILGKGRLEGEYIPLHHAPQSYQYVYRKCE